MGVTDAAANASDASTAAATGLTRIMALVIVDGSGEEMSGEGCTGADGRSMGQKYAAVAATHLMSSTDGHLPSPEPIRRLLCLADRSS